jgi:hypothetical protein
MPKQAAPQWFTEAVERVFADPSSIEGEPALCVVVDLAHIYAHAVQLGLDLPNDALQAHIKLLDALSEMRLFQSPLRNLGDVDSRLILAGLARTLLSAMTSPPVKDFPQLQHYIKVGEEKFRSHRQKPYQPTEADFRKLMGGVTRPGKRTKGTGREAKLAFRLWPAFPTLLRSVAHARDKEATPDSIQALWMEGATVLMLLKPGENGSRILERVIRFGVRDGLRDLTLARLCDRKSPVRGYSPRCNPPCLDEAMAHAFGYVRRAATKESYRAEIEDQEQQMHPRTRRRNVKRGSVGDGEVLDKDRIETINEENQRRSRHETPGFYSQARAAEALGVSRATLQRTMRRAEVMGQVYQKSKKTSAYLLTADQLRFLLSILAGSHPIVAEAQDEPDAEQVDDDMAEIAAEFASFTRDPWSGHPMGSR